MALAKQFKKDLEQLSLNVLTALKEVVGKRKLELNRPIIVVEHGEENEVIIAINKDLMTDIEFVHEIDENWANIADYPIHIQIAVLETIENGDFEEIETEE